MKSTVGNHVTKNKQTETKKNTHTQANQDKNLPHVEFTFHLLTSFFDMA